MQNHLRRNRTLARVLQIGLLVLPSALLLSASLAWGMKPQEPNIPAPAEPPKSKLLETLDEELFRPSRPLTDRLPTNATLQERLKRELGAAGQSETSSPLVEVNEWMHEAAARLAAGESGEETQALQRRAIERLSELLKSSSSPSGNRSRAATTKTLTASANASKAGAQPGVAPAATAPDTAAAGTPRASEGASAQPAEQIWGELPERQREQLLHLPAESLPPEYRAMIETYYRRLAGENEAPAR